MTSAQPGYGYVLDDLAIGSKPPPGERLPFDVLIITAYELNAMPGYRSDASYPGVTVVRISLDDSILSPGDVRKAFVTARTAANYVRRGQRVLVVCNQGRNRSGLVTALALMDLGSSSRGAIRRVRAVRGDDALSNPYFVQLLKQRDQRRVS